MELYCIELDRKTNRKYISYIDKNWYQTTYNPIYLWTEEECKNLLPYFKASFIWGYDIVDVNGNRKHIGASSGIKYENGKIAGGLTISLLSLDSLSKLKPKPKRN